MKKAIILLLTLVFAIILAACNNSGDALSDEYSDVIVETIVKDKNNTTDPDDAESIKDSTGGTSAPVSDNTTSSVVNAGSSGNNENHTHTYSAATCSEPAKCACGATSGKKAEHTYTAATCTAPKTCSLCGATKGNPTAHKYSNGKCSVCGADEPFDINTLMSGATFVGNLRSNLTASGITFRDRSSDGLHNGLRCHIYNYQLSEDSSKTSSITINNKKYFVENTVTNEYGIEINGNEIVVKADDDSVLLKLKATNNQSLTVISSNLPEFPANTVLTIG